MAFCGSRRDPDPHSAPRCWSNKVWFIPSGVVRAGVVLV